MPGIGQSVAGARQTRDGHYPHLKLANGKTERYKIQNIKSLIPFGTFADVKYGIIHQWVVIFKRVF
jgi:hypothetical protein